MLASRSTSAADDGAYARSERLTRAQIKAWFGSEKARRKKKGAAAALREALPDDPGEGSGAKQKPKPMQKQAQQKEAGAQEAARMQAEKAALLAQVDAAQQKAAQKLLVAYLCFCVCGSLFLQHLRCSVRH